MALPIFELDNIHKVYPPSWWGRPACTALRGVSLRVAAGEVFGLIGPNRAGKTTLVKILLSLCQPSAGHGHRFNRPLTDRRTLARVGYVHEHHAFPGYLTAAAALQFYGALSLLPEEVVRVRTPRLLELVGLADRSQEPIRRFSKGMLQRLSMAQALINEPDLLVLDEPGEGLDLGGRALLREVIAQQRRAGKGVLLISHSLPEVERLCDRVGVLVAGRLVRITTVAELTKASDPGEAGLEHAVAELYQSCAV